MLELANLSLQQGRLPDRFDRTANTVTVQNDVEQGVLAASSVRHADYARNDNNNTSSNPNNNNRTNPIRRNRTNTNNAATTSTSRPKTAPWRHHPWRILLVAAPLGILGFTYWRVSSSETTAATTWSFPWPKQRFGGEERSGQKCFTTNQELRDAVHTYLETQAGRDVVQQQQRLDALYGPDLEHWCVSYVTDFTEVFARQNDPRALEFLQQLDLKHWDMSRATTLHGMFDDCHGCTGRGLEQWEITAQLTNLQHVFRNAHHLDANLTRWDTSSVTSLRGAFSNAESFRGTGLDQWNVTHVRDASFCFDGATVMDADLGAWKVDQVETMDAMFRNAASFTGVSSSLSEWNVQRVTNLQHMFDGATSFAQDLCRWGVALPRTTNNSKEEAEAADETQMIYTDYMFRNTKCPDRTNPVRDHADSPYCFPCAGEDAESGY